MPAFQVVNTCRQGRYRIEKMVLTDPRRSAVLQQIQFVPLSGQAGGLLPLCPAQPAPGQPGGRATPPGSATTRACPCSSPTRRVRPGLGLLRAVAETLGWLRRRLGRLAGRLRTQANGWAYERAENGNVALTGEVDLAASGGRFVLALGFGRDEGEAGHRARASLLQGFETARKATCRRGPTGRRACCRWRDPSSIRRTCTASARRSCGPTSPSTSPAASSPAWPCLGVSPRATATWATTWSGRAT